MDKLNVTGSEWEVEYFYGSYCVKVKDSDVYVTDEIEEGDAYLLAQAKNMYEMLSELLRNEECDVFEMGCEIQELLNACKPPE